jgi:hypothetical protein
MTTVEKTKILYCTILFRNVDEKTMLSKIKSIMFFYKRSTILLNLLQSDNKRILKTTARNWLPTTTPTAQSFTSSTTISQ